MSACEYEYKVYEEPTEYPITVDDIKMQTRVDRDDTEHNTYLQNYIIKPVVAFAQKYTSLYFLTTKIITYRDTFDNIIEMRRAPYATLISFKYYNTSDILVDVPAANYFVTERYRYSKIYPKDTSSFNITDIRDQLDSIEIRFSCGFAATKLTLPSGVADIQLALLQHATYLYQNRGDCGSSPEKALPANSKKIYDFYRSYEISGISHV